MAKTDIRRTSSGIVFSGKSKTENTSLAHQTDESLSIKLDSHIISLMTVLVKQTLVIMLFFAHACVCWLAGCAVRLAFFNF